MCFHVFQENRPHVFLFCKLIEQLHNREYFIIYRNHPVFARLSLYTAYHIPFIQKDIFFQYSGNFAVSHAGINHY